MARDLTKYRIIGTTDFVGKGKLALKVVESYISMNGEISVDKLQEVFPDAVQGRVFIRELLDVVNNGDISRFHKYPLNCSPGTALVSNQWGSSNIGNLIELCQRLGIGVENQKGEVVSRQRIAATPLEEREIEHFAENHDPKEFTLLDFKVPENSVDALIGALKVDEPILPLFHFIPDTLRRLGRDCDLKTAHFYLENCLISDRNIPGDLIVDFNGVYSSLGSDSYQMLFDWDSAQNMKVRRTEGGVMIALCKDESCTQMLTIEEKGGTTLRILLTMYYKIFKVICDEFRSEPSISWNKVKELGITRIPFDSMADYIEHQELMNDIDNYLKE